MTNSELISLLKSKSKSERELTAEIVRLVALGLQQQIWRDTPYADMHRFLTQECGYSSGSADRRINAAKATLVYPQVVDRLADAGLALTTVCAVQRAITAEEKRVGAPLPRDVKGELFSRAIGCSLQEVQQTIAKVLPAQKPKRPEGFDAVAGDEWRLGSNHNDRQKRKLDRIRQVLSHAMGNASWGDTLEKMSDDFLKRHDPLERAKRRKKPTRSILTVTQSTKDEVIAKAEGKCEHPGCGSEWQIEVDHIIPKSKGGTNDPSNLRALCDKHNRLRATH